MSGLNPTRPSALRELWLGAVADHVIALAWSPDGKTLAAASVEGPITLFDGALGAARQTLPGHGFGTTAVSWSSDSRLLASAGQDSLARAWCPDGREQFRVEGGADWVEHVSWSPVGGWLATAAGRKLRVWDSLGNLTRDYEDHPSTIAALAWKPRAAMLATAAYGRIALWEPTRDEPHQVFPWKGSMLLLGWSPDGRAIATGDQDATVHYWNVATGRDLMMYGYATKIRALAWVAAGRYLVTAGGQDVTAWNCSGTGPEGTEPLVFDRRRAAITALASHPLAPVLAVGGADGRLRLWTLGKEAERLCLASLGSEVTRLAWHPSGRALAAGTATGTVAAFSTP